MSFENLYSDHKALFFLVILVLFFLIKYILDKIKLPTSISTNLNDLQKVEKLIMNNRVLLFMNGTRIFPKCEFSKNTLIILDEYNIKYTTINILEDDEIKFALNTYHGWPSFPQLFVNTEFIGGFEKISKLHKDNYLKDILE